MAVDRLSAVFGALADPTRRAILTRLTEGDATVAELAAPFRVSQSAISQHLKVLERAGLITRGRSAQWRPSRLEMAPLDEATDWIGRYREAWRGRFDRLDVEIQRLKAKQRSSREGESGNE